MGLRTRFDAQAAGFDRRAGLGPDVARQVAAAILAHSRGAMVEVGPGTGELGEHLAAAAHRYVGIDSSGPMLAAFAARRPLPGTALLVRADAARAWPVRAGSADVVFASRAAHLLDPAHVCREVVRVSGAGGTFLTGRVQRADVGLRARMRARRLDLLAEHGLGGGDGRAKERRLFEAFTAVAAVPVPPDRVASWTVETNADEVIASWEEGGVRGGRPVPPDLAAAVMARLRDDFGGQSELETETYILEGVRLP